MENDGRWVINLGNSICGVSLLALPYCYSQCGVILGSALLLSSALLTYWSCQLLIDCIFATKTISCEGIAHKVYGSYGKLILEISSVLLMIGTCSAFFVIIADLAPMVFSWLTSIPSNAPYLRGIIMFSLAVSVIFPLSLLRQLDSLSAVSTASLCFYAWLTLQLIVYALQKLSTSQVTVWRSAGIFHAVPIYAMAFACHLQLVAIIKELVGEIHEGDAENCSRIKKISKWAVSIVALVYGSAALFGHIAFSSSGVQGDVLANFDNGIMAQTTRIGFTLSVIVSFPFMVNPCRATVSSFMFGKNENYLPSTKHMYITVGILTVAFLVAVYTPNVELVLALTGSICGATICYIFPSLSYLMIVRDEENNNKWKAFVVLVIGIFLLFGGTLASLLPSASPPSNVIDNLVINSPHQVQLGGGVEGITQAPLVKLDDDKVRNEKDVIKTLRVLTSEKDTNKSIIKTSLQEPAKLPVQEPKPAVQDPVLEKLPVKEQPVQKPVLQKPTVQEPVKPPLQEAILNKPPVQDSVLNRPPAQDPVIDKPPVQDPVLNKPAAGQEQVQKRSAVQREPLENKPVQDQEQPIHDKASVQEPSIEKPVAKEPAVPVSSAVQELPVANEQQQQQGEQYHKSL